jgi:hypothetical protein
MLIGVRREPSPFNDFNSGDSGQIPSSAWRKTGIVVADHSWEISGESVECKRETYESSWTHSISKGGARQHVLESAVRNDNFQISVGGAPYCISTEAAIVPSGSCHDTHWGNVLYPIFQSDRWYHQSAPKKITWTADATEKVESYGAGGRDDQCYVCRAGPSRDLVLWVTNQINKIPSGTEKIYKNADPRGCIQGEQWETALMNVSGYDAEGNRIYRRRNVLFDPIYYDICPHFDKHPSLDNQDYFGGSGSYGPDVGEGDYVQWVASNVTSELTQTITREASSTNQFSGKITGSVELTLNADVVEDALIDFSAPTRDEKCMEKLINLSASANGNLVGLMTDFSQVSTGGFDDAPISGVFVGWA